MASGLPRAGELDAVEKPVRVRTPGKHIVLCVATAFLIFSLSTSFLQVRDPKPSSAEVVSAPASVDSEHVALDPFLVDLSPDINGRVTYLKLSAIIEVSDPDARATIRAREAIIRERLIFLLRHMTPSDFEGSEAMERLKRELLRRVDLVIAPQAADDVMVNDLVIQ